MNLKMFSPEVVAYKGRILLDRFRGLDFLTVIKPEDVGLDAKYAFRSSPSGSKILNTVLSDFNISSQDSIIDIGCGKGNAIRAMLKFPFARIDGIEISDHIANIASRNFKKLKANRSKIFIGDATLFKEYDTYNVVYFYNPFTCSVMLNVINALIQSIHRSERELILIYNNAVCNDAVISQSVFERIGEYPDKYGHGITIYSNRKYNNSRLSFNKVMIQKHKAHD